MVACGLYISSENNPKCFYYALEMFDGSGCMSVSLFSETNRISCFDHLNVISMCFVVDLIKQDRSKVNLEHLSTQSSKTLIELEFVYVCL